MTTQLAVKPWWTSADAADLDLLTAEFVRAYWAHREHCSVCSVPGQPWCASLRDAFEAVEEWRDRRVRLSHSVWLRARQDFKDWAAA